MNTMDRRRGHPPGRTVPLEVAEAWRDEAMAARRQLDDTRAELEAAREALREARPAEPPPAPPPLHLAPPEEPAADGRIARLAADLANVRRHRDEEVARARQHEKIEGLRALGEVHDDLQRSLDAMPDQSSPWFHGHRSILAKVRSMLRQAGASLVGSVGEPFDPNVHEAVGTAPGIADLVAEVDQPGFQLEDGTLVRPARVRVGDGAREVRR